MAGSISRHGEHGALIRPNNGNSPIRIAAAVIANGEGRILLVRKRSTLFFMQPGGKLEEGETALETLARELHEELGCTLFKAEFVGVFSARAANEAAHVVEAMLFFAKIDGDITPGAEIEQVAWIDPVRRATFSWRH
jgi:8-oxo-dGTP diphosphatase